jgi:hypothetical protein
MSLLIAMIIGEWGVGAGMKGTGYDGSGGGVLTNVGSGV